MPWIDVAIKVVSIDQDYITIQVGPHTVPILINELKTYLQGHFPFETLKKNMAIFLAVSAVNLGSAAAIKTALEGTTFKFPG